MQDSERGSAAQWERAGGEGSGVSAKRRSRRRWSAEEKARIVRESFWPGKRVEDVARRYGLPPITASPEDEAWQERIGDLLRELDNALGRAIPRIILRGGTGAKLG